MALGKEQRKLFDRRAKSLNRYAATLVKLQKVMPDKKTTRTYNVWTTACELCPNIKNRLHKNEYLEI